MNKRDLLIEELIREIILCELKFKSPFKKKLSTAWHKFKQKFGDAIKIDQGEKTSKKDFHGFRGYDEDDVDVIKSRSKISVAELVNSWFDEMESGIGKQIPKNVRRNTIEKARKIFNVALKSGKSPQASAGAVMKFLSKNFGE
jgi:hypothetical protein